MDRPPGGVRVSENDQNLWFIEPDGSNREEIRRLGYRFIDLLVDSGSEASSRLPVPEPGGPLTALNRLLRPLPKV